MTFAELMVVVMIVGLIAAVVQVNFFGAWERNTFKGHLHDLVSSLNMAAQAAAESERRFELRIDLTDQTYRLRQMNNLDLDEIVEDDIIEEGSFENFCRVQHVQFDDNDFTSEDIAIFRVGRAGWLFGGKIVVSDLRNPDQVYSIVINRLLRTVTLEDGEVELLEPKDQEGLFF